MAIPHDPLDFFLDLDPPVADFRADVLAGLSAVPRTLSPKYLYDEAGSEIFNQITTLADYYPTRTERALIDEHAEAIGAAIGPGRAVFEYGSGSAAKIRQLLALMQDPLAYVALDISRDHLLDNTIALARDIDMPVGAVCADFNAAVAIPQTENTKGAKWLGYFPGSTIGNLSPKAATAFLNTAAQTLGQGSKFLIGLDLQKADTNILRRAYDDDEGVTAAFNLNLLQRIKRELDADLDLSAFKHELRINSAPQRIEMHLAATRDTEITISGETFAFRKGDTLHTENSYKYDLSEFSDLLAETPWQNVESWTDRDGLFATCLLSNG